MYHKKSFPSKKKSGKQFFFLGSLCRHLREKKVYSFLVNRDISKNQKFKKNHKIFYAKYRFSWLKFLVFHTFLSNHICYFEKCALTQDTLSQLRYLQNIIFCRRKIDETIVNELSVQKLFQLSNGIFVACLQHLQSA